MHTKFFTLFTKMYYLPDHPLNKQSTAKFPIMLDSFLTEVDSIRRAVQQVVAKGPTWSCYGPFRAQNWLEFRKFIQVIIQYYKAVQSYTVISWLAKAVSKSQTAIALYYQYNDDQGSIMIINNEHIIKTFFEFSRLAWNICIIVITIVVQWYKSTTLYVHIIQTLWYVHSCYSTNLCANVFIV